MKNTLYIIGCLFTIILTHTVKAQNGVIIEESKQIKDLMEVRNETAKLEKCFRIQIFNGSINEANEIIEKLKESSDLPVDMTFETPNYKVRIGKFRTRMEAEKNLIKIREDYPAAFVIFS